MRIVLHTYLHPKHVLLTQRMCGSCTASDDWTIALKKVRYVALWREEIGGTVGPLMELREPFVACGG